MTEFRRSSYCVGESNCVEIGMDGRIVLIRNSRDPDRVLVFTPEDWNRFVDFLTSTDSLMRP